MSLFQLASNKETPCHSTAVIESFIVITNPAEQPSPLPTAHSLVSDSDGMGADTIDN